MNILDNIPDEPMEVSIAFPTQAYFLSGIRDFTLNLVKNVTGFSEQWAFRFQSIVDELCNNAIEFGSAPGDEIKITFITEKSKRITLFVADKGTGPQNNSAEHMKELVEERRTWDHTKTMSIRGRGLPQIVANWTDDLDFIDKEGGGLIVKAVKNLDQDQV